MVTLVPLDKIDLLWPRLKGFIEAGIKKTDSETPLAEYFRMVRTGNCLLFVFQVDNELCGALIADIINTRHGQTARIWAFSSERTVDYDVEFGSLWNFFRDLGVVKVMCEGRRGFQKHFPKAKIARYVYEMDI